jgi:hypothetical protein
VNLCRKPGVWTYVAALSCMAVTAAVACGNSSSNGDVPGSSSTTCSFSGPGCQYGCSPTLGCVECLSGADCPDNAPVCVPDLGQCGQCAQTSDCNTGEVCEPATHACAAACTTNNDCTGFGGPGGGNSATICDTTTHACVGCTADTAATVCTGSRTLCDPVRMQCAQCLSRANCGVATPACDMQTGTCVQCLVDTDCRDGACATDHLCHPFCHANSDCTAPNRPVCDTQTGICGECAADADCATNPNTPRCNTTSHTCVGCTANADCAATPTTPVCQTRTNQCVACAANADCPSTAPICRTRGGGAGGATPQCVQCQANTDCTSAALPRCDAQTGTCVQCVTNADCTAATPTCTNGTCV